MTAGSRARGLVLARIIEPVSNADSLRVLEEAGQAAPSYATFKRRLPAYTKLHRFRPRTARRRPARYHWPDADDGLAAYRSLAKVIYAHPYPL